MLTTARLNRFGLMVCGMLVGTTTLGHAATLETAQIGNWAAAAFTNDQTGAFSGCLMSVTYKSGIKLIFSIDRRYDWSMALANTKWRLETGASYPIRYAIDDFEPISATAKVLSPTTVSVQLRDTTDLFQAFRRGRLMAIRAGTETFSFRLDGTSDGLAWLIRCVKRYEDYAPPAPNAANPFGGGNRAASPGTLPPAGAILNSPGFRPGPVAPSPAPAPVPAPPPARSIEPAIEARVAPATPVAPAPQPTPPAAAPAIAAPASSVPTPGSIEGRVEATIFLASLMASTGVSDYRVMPPGEAPEKHRGADVVFSFPDGVVGTVRVAAMAEARAVTNAIIAADAQACTGQYASGSVPSAGGRGDVAHVFTGCDQSGSPAAARYTVLARKRGGFFVVGVYAQGAGAVADRLKQIDGSIREASASVVGRF